MVNHKKVYFKHFGIGEQDVVYCEITGLQCSEIHHIEPRGHGVKGSRDFIENLVAVTRKVHDKCRIPDYNKKVKIIHLEFTKSNPYFDYDFNWENHLKFVNEIMNK